MEAVSKAAEVYMKLKITSFHRAALVRGRVG